jgi:hypothetical protein
VVQAALDETASSWLRRLTGPVLLADRGSDDAEVARRAAASVAARAGVPLRIGRFPRWAGSHRQPASWMYRAYMRTQPAQRRTWSGTTSSRWDASWRRLHRRRERHGGRRADGGHD